MAASQAIVLANWTQFCTELLTKDVLHTSWTFTVNDIIFDSPRVEVLGIYGTVLNHASSPLTLTNIATVIEGQSGIGKSTFAIILMRHLMAAGIGFVYSSQGDDFMREWSMDGGAPVVRVHLMSDPTPIFDANILWIMNQSEHGNFKIAKCRRVLITSTDDSHSKQYKSHAGAHLKVIHMPLPTADDVRRIALAHGVPLAAIEERLEKVGCIPRYVSAGDFEEVEIKLQAALDRCNFQVAIYNSEVQSTGGERLSNRIFYEGADPVTLAYTRRQFGSEYIQHMYMKAWQQKQVDTFNSFIATRNGGDMPTEYGKAFERRAHHVLAAGGKFRMRTLHGLNHAIPLKRARIRSNVSFPARDKIIVSNNLNLAAVVPAQGGAANVHNRYLEPKSSNFGAVDSLVIEPASAGGALSDLFQITVNRAHGMNGTQLDALMNHIYGSPVGRAGATMRLIFVVPDYIFERFDVQAYHTGGGVGAVNITAANLNCIEQYVLEIPTD